MTRREIATKVDEIVGELDALARAADAADDPRARTRLTQAADSLAGVYCDMVVTERTPAPQAAGQ